MSTRKSRRRARARRNAQTRAQHQPDAGMRATTTAFTNACHNLIDPQPHPQPGRHAPCRYTALRQALYTHHGGNGSHTRAHTIPASIDALKYLGELDALARTLAHRYPAHYCQIAHRHAHPTIQALAGVATHRWHGRDNQEQIQADTTVLVAYAHKIDDLFATKPLYLPNPCPQCGHTHAHKLNDEGEVVRTPGALAVTAERGAWCQQCHNTWAPEQLQFLGRLLGYRPLVGVVPAFTPPPLARNHTFVISQATRLTCL